MAPDSCVTDADCNSTAGTSCDLGSLTHACRCEGGVDSCKYRGRCVDFCALPEQQLFVTTKNAVRQGAVPLSLSLFHCFVALGRRTAGRCFVMSVLLCC